MSFLLLAAFLGLAEGYLSSGLLSISITRHHKGDVFVAQGGTCYKDFCVSLSSGTAEPTGNGDCECRCATSRPVFRDDLNTCVDDIQECSVVPFVSGSATKKVPYVFLPLKGQIVYPSADILMSDEAGPVCVVSGGQFLGQSGWLSLRNHSRTEIPFRLFRDEGRTYLQWLGETNLRMAMEGRIILVHLMCKDANAVEEPKIFTPCIGFRVAGNPITDVKEMLFATDVHLKENYGTRLSVREYVAIGVCSLLLAVVYVAAVVLYLYIRKRKQKNGSKKNGNTAMLTLGEEGIVKSNPLLQAPRNLTTSGHDNAGYVSETNSSCSDADRTSDLLCLDDDDDDDDDDGDDGDGDNPVCLPSQMQTSAIIHPCDLDQGEPALSQDPNNREKLPEENVSIVETLETREHPETVKGMSCVNGRRKLYFNPSYFEPDLLKAPPPAAVEFLIKIREVIAIAKHKMSAKKFSPSLLGIPEEDSTSKVDCNSNLTIRRSSPVATQASTDLHASSGELFWPSDTKQKIIRKWLEDVSLIVLKEDNRTAEKDLFQDKRKLRQTNEKNTERAGSLRLSTRKGKKRSKGRAPPVPLVKADEPPTSFQLESTATPQPPPMPAFQHYPDHVSRWLEKNGPSPGAAKNLMDAVIQELTKFKKNERNSKLIDFPEKTRSALEKNKENGVPEAGSKETEEDAEENVNTLPTAGGNVLPEGHEKTKTTTSGVLQDDHEYEIILLNPDQPSNEGKQVKIYNLPEILSKNDRSQGYSLVSEVYVNDGYSCCSGESPPSSFSNLSVGSENVHYDVPKEKPGRLTIHVNDSPERYKTLASESDGFEPDTLDRKPRRSKGVKEKAADGDRYSNQKFHEMENHVNVNTSEKFTDSLERPSILLKTNGTFKGNSLESNIDDLLKNFSWNKVEGFGSLREIYEAKSRRHKTRETSSLIEGAQSDHDRVSTLSWSEERRNKLLHRGIILHINEEGKNQRRTNRQTIRRDSKVLNPPNGSFGSSKPSISPRHSPSSTPTPCSHSSSRSASPNIFSNRASPISRFSFSPRTTSPPLPPPRSIPPSPPPRLTSSLSPSLQLPPRSAASSPKPCKSSPARSSSPLSHPTLHLASHSSPLPPPPRPPKTIQNSPFLPPRNSKPPLPPKSLKNHPKPGKFAGRPLPPLPRPTADPFFSSPAPPRDPETLSTLSGASIDSLNSSDYETFYTLPYVANEHAPDPGAPDPARNSKNCATKTTPVQHSPLGPHKVKPCRPEDSGYLSTDSDTCCPSIAFPARCVKIPESITQNSETDESLCDGASESGAESIATDSFFYGVFYNRSRKTSESGEKRDNMEDRDEPKVRPCALRLSDVEVNSDTERHCVPIMVRP